MQPDLRPCSAGPSRTAPIPRQRLLDTLLYGISYITMPCSLLLEKIYNLARAGYALLLRGQAARGQLDISPVETEEPTVGELGKTLVSNLRDPVEESIGEPSCDIQEEPIFEQKEEQSPEPQDDPLFDEKKIPSNEREEVPFDQPEEVVQGEKVSSDDRSYVVSVTEDGSDNAAVTREPLPSNPEKILASENLVARSPGIVLAEVAARDLRKKTPLLSHFIKVPDIPESIDVPDMQEAVLVVRMAVFDIMLSELLKGDTESPQQLVLFAPGIDARIIERQELPSPLSIFAVNDVAIAQDCERDARRLEALLPDGVEYIHVQAVLEGWVWDSGLVLHGYNWQLPSVWVMQLDVTNMAKESLERHFRMIGTLASPGSLILVVYASPDFVSKVSANKQKWKGTPPSFSCVDPFALARRCGFQVEFAISLRDAAMKYAFPDDVRNKLAVSEFSEGVRFAIFSHWEQNKPSASPFGDVISDITAYSTVSGTLAESSAPSGISASAAPTLAIAGNHSSLGDFEDYMNSDHRVIRFELQLSTLPRHLALPEYSMVLIGSESSVGCWDPQRAKKMHGDISAAGAVLTTDLSLSVHACDVEYKYAVTNARQDIVAWEVGSNRRLGGPSNEDESEPDFVQCIRDEWRFE